EMARLCDDTIPEIQSDRLGAARQKAKETGAVVALKGAATVVAAPDGRCAVNTTGNPGMAKGGSGDVLAGMAGAFLAQGVPAFETAVLAVYLHGLAGDVCAQRYTQRAMLPTDLPQALPQVFRRFL
ncbi:MAG: ADP/ATP-dependent (S)-NAD(P)H-hydrate dehydratase, partial [Acutalibacter sp.]